MTNGGMTTFLSVILLGGSKSHIFITFWKIFFFTVIFGLFHGVIVLPVALCYFGPSEKKGDESKCEENGQVNEAVEEEANDVV